MSLTVPQTQPKQIPADQKALALRHASESVAVPIRRISVHREAARVFKRGVCLGTDSDGQVVYLHPKHLRTHLHLIGPTRQGKSRFILWLFKLL
jgi:hypothetical protein